MVDVEDPPLISFDQPQPPSSAFKFQIERSSFLEENNKHVIERTEITERLGKDSLASIAATFENGLNPNPEPVPTHEREDLKLVDRNQYSNFKNKFEHLDEELEKERQAKLAKLRRTEDVQGPGKEKHYEILNKFEKRLVSEQKEMSPEEKTDYISLPEVREETDQETFQMTNGHNEDHNECFVCGNLAFAAENLHSEDKVFHHYCFKCNKCRKVLTLQNYGIRDGKLFCNVHVKGITIPGALGLSDFDVLKEETCENSESEDDASFNSPKELNPEIVKSGMKATEDFGQVPNLRNTKTLWETSVETAEVKGERKTELEADLCMEGKVKSQVTKFADPDIPHSSDEDFENDESSNETDSMIEREDRKKKYIEITKSEVSSITSKWESGTLAKLHHEKENLSSEFDEIKKNVPLKDRFREKTSINVDHNCVDDRHSVVAPVDYAAVNSTSTTRDRFSKPNAPVEQSFTDEIYGNDHRSSEENVMNGHAEPEEQQAKVKTEIDVRCTELKSIKNRFEAGDIHDDISEPPKVAVEEEFRNFKMQRLLQQEKERQEAEQASETPTTTPFCEVPDDVRQSQDIGNIKKRFEEGVALAPEFEADKREVETKLDIRTAGIAREKFRKIDEESPGLPAPPTHSAKQLESKWAKDEKIPAPEPVNRRVEQDTEDTEPEDFEVKNLLSKFKNLENKGDEEDSQTPKPKRQITPPPSGYKAEIESQVAEPDPSVVRGGEETQAASFSSDAKNLRAKFEAQATESDVPGETAEEKRKRLEDEFQMYKDLKEKEKEAEPIEPKEPDQGPKEDLGISAEHAQKMKAKWEKIHKKEAKRAEKSLRKPAQTVARTPEPDFCYICREKVYATEKIEAHARIYHKLCFKCKFCGIALRLGNDAGGPDGCYCKNHYKELFNNMSRMLYDGRSRETASVN